MAGQHRFAIGNTWGRPPIFENPEELAAKILEYFIWCEGDYIEKEVEVKDKKTKEVIGKEVRKIYTRDPEKYTITGLCLYVGFESRSTFDKQAERSQEFSYIVKRAKMIVANGYESALWGDKPTGPIFALKNMGWSDRTESIVSVDANVKQNVTFEAYDKLSDAALEEIASLESSEGESGALPA